MSKLALILIAMMGFNMPMPAFPRDRTTLKEERQVIPACVGIKDGAEWAKCMEKFKDIRPQHPPTNLMLDDWRNPS